MDDDTEHKQAKETKNCIMKRKLMCENHRDCLLNNKIILKSQHKDLKVIIIMYRLNKSIRLH